MIEAVVARIDELGYLDDYAYARRRASLMASRGYGDYAIRAFLEGLGLPEGLISDAMASLPEHLSERLRMNMMIEKKRDLKQVRLIRFLAGRGFPLDMIMETLSGVDR